MDIAVLAIAFIGALTLVLLLTAGTASRRLTLSVFISVGLMLAILLAIVLIRTPVVSSDSIRPSISPTTPPSPDPASTRPGCLNRKPVSAEEVGDPVYVDATVRLGKCLASVGENDEPGDGTFNSVTTGDRVRLRLLSTPLQDHINPLAAEIQRLSDPVEVGLWSWEVTPPEPGEYRLTLILSVISAEGEEVELENERITFKIVSEGTLDYYFTSTLNRTSEFFQSVSGAVTAAVTAAVVALTAFPQIRKAWYSRRKDPQSEEEASVMDSEDSGYL